MSKSIKLSKDTVEVKNIKAGKMEIINVLEYQPNLKLVIEMLNNPKFRSFKISEISGIGPVNIAHFRKGSVAIDKTNFLYLILLTRTAEILINEEENGKRM